MPNVIGIEQLDQWLAQYSKGVTYDAATAASLNEHELAIPDGLPRDPFGDEYREFQWSLYERIAGKPYSLTNESIPFDVDKAAECPYPFNTGSAQTVGLQYLAIGSILRAMNLPVGARILEFGAGWGNTSLTLAKTGFDVTAVDLEPRFCELIQRRALKEGVRC
jgi:hypothetical protein